MTRAAVAFAQIGVPVIPLWGIDEDGHCTCERGAECTSQGKHPRWSGWQSATSNPGAVLNYFDAFARKGTPANIGLRLIDVGLAVIDVDSAEGAEALAGLVGDDELAQMPCAMTARGVHYYVRTSKAPGIIAPGLEVKSENVVAPPSLCAGGLVRSWAAGRELTSVDAVPCMPLSINRMLSTREHVYRGERRSGSAGAVSVSILPSAEVIAQMLVKSGVPVDLVRKHIWSAA